MMPSAVSSSEPNKWALAAPIAHRYSSRPNSVTTFNCSLDAAAFAACTSPQTYSGLTNGSHTFQVRAVDAAGNVDPTPATYTWARTAELTAAAYAEVAP